MSVEAEWVGGPYDGQRIQVEHWYVHVIEQTAEPSAERVTESASPMAARAWREVTVPVRRWSDGRFRLTWADRTPR